MHPPVVRYDQGLKFEVLDPHNYDNYDIVRNSRRMMSVIREPPTQICGSDHSGKKVGMLWTRGR